MIFAGHINALNSIEIKDLNFIQPTFEENTKYIMKLKVGVNSLFIIMLLHIYLSCYILFCNSTLFLYNFYSIK